MNEKNASLKTKLIYMLYKNRGQYVSGEKLSEELGVTRAAIWKHIKSLKSEGFEIQASTNKGYVFISGPDFISEEEIAGLINTKILHKSIFCFSSIDSTNEYVKKLANEGYPEGTTVIADMQTKGKGRLGRKWSSKYGLGIYMSILLRPRIIPVKVPVLTLAASIAVADAIKHLYNLNAGIKWPNDIILDDKKVCGILCEMSCELEGVDYVVLGIGMNVFHKQNHFEDDYKNTATSIMLSLKNNNVQKKYDVRRNHIIAEIINRFDEIYDKILNNEKQSVIDLYRKYSVTVGRRLRFISGNKEFEGDALDINEDGSLVIKKDDGTICSIISGEVSVRGIMGYL